MRGAGWMSGGGVEQVKGYRRGIRVAIRCDDGFPVSEWAARNVRLARIAGRARCAGQGARRGALVRVVRCRPRRRATGASAMSNSVTDRLVTSPGSARPHRRARARRAPPPTPHWTTGSTKQLNAWTPSGVTTIDIDGHPSQSGEKPVDGHPQRLRRKYHTSACCAEASPNQQVSPTSHGRQLFRYKLKLVRSRALTRAVCAPGA